jgi:hypothetical protein
MLWRDARRAAEDVVPEETRWRAWPSESGVALAGRDIRCAAKGARHLPAGSTMPAKLQVGTLPA